MQLLHTKIVFVRQRVAQDMPITYFNVHVLCPSIQEPTCSYSMRPAVVHSVQLAVSNHVMQEYASICMTSVFPTASNMQHKDDNAKLLISSVSIMLMYLCKHHPKANVLHHCHEGFETTSVIGSLFNIKTAWNNMNCNQPAVRPVLACWRNNCQNERHQDVQQTSCTLLITALSPLACQSCKL